MSEAASIVRAIDAISLTLAERMAIILHDLPSIDRKGQRYSAYAAGGIDLNDYAIDEAHDADLCALSSELLRRLTQ